MLLNGMVQEDAAGCTGAHSRVQGLAFEGELVGAQEREAGGDGRLGRHGSHVCAEKTTQRSLSAVLSNWSGAEGSLRRRQARTSPKYTL